LEETGVLKLKLFFMKKIFLFPVLFISAAGMLFGCRKETSCAGCKENNKPPIAIAGPDLVITLPTDSIFLDGTASSDPEGMISERSWKKIEGPASFAISNSSVAKTKAKNLVAGAYKFELTVTDDKGASAKDTIMVTVDAMQTSNHAPVANAGIDQTIVLPVNTSMLNGSGSTDPENYISSFLWTKISGPTSPAIAIADSAITAVADLIEGVYQFELEVTNASGFSAKDTVQMTVMKAVTACTSCKIVFVSDRDGNDEIYSCNADGSNIQRLTNDPQEDEEPGWSPDGTQIAFTSDRSGSFELYIMNADGSNVVNRAFSGNWGGSPTWSPDGTRIAYALYVGGTTEIRVVGATSGPSVLLLKKQGMMEQPAWSPDGTKIAFATDWDAFDIVTDIYSIRTDGT
jgi:hypothetical protein